MNDKAPRREATTITISTGSTAGDDVAPPLSTEVAGAVGSGFGTGVGTGAGTGRTANWVNTPVVNDWVGMQLGWT